MHLTFDKTLNLHLTHDGQLLATASLGLYRGADYLLTRFQNITYTENRATGTLHLENEGRLDFQLSYQTPRENVLLLELTFTNPGPTPISFDRVLAPTLHLNRDAFPPAQPLWTMQGAAVFWGQDFAFPLHESTRSRGFARENFLGHLQDGEGGGIPVVYFWNQARGLAMMHLAPTPQDWYMPVKSGKEGITAAFELRHPITLAPGESFECLPVLLS
ncbi:MAG TPA: hypothetical protein PK530_20755, partial [Anaerolineales bacterium]|nr:hypothetical protein [Anaerolineales bacterium]